MLEAVADGIDQHGITATGRVTLSPSGHKLTADIEFSNVEAEPIDGDTLQLGLHVQTGHSRFHAVTYDVGAERRVCSNRMTAFVDELHYEQSHQEPFQPGLAHQAVAAVMDGTDTVETRLQAARAHEFMNTDEAVLTLMDHGINWYIDADSYTEAADLLRRSLHDELNNPDQPPTLYDTYNAATRAITHQSDAPDYRRSDGLEQAAQLLETGGNQLPNIDTVAQDAIKHRIQEVGEADENEIEHYWEGETESLRELVEARGLAG